MIFCVYRNKFSAKFRSKKVVYLKHKIKKVMLVFPATALTIVIYIFLHEIGHLIVMVSAGATITDFSILTAHVYLFGWIFLPCAYVNGNAPAADDVTKFLDIFSRNCHPLLVSLAAMIMVGSGVALMLKKRMFQNFIAEIR